MKGKLRKLIGMLLTLSVLAASVVVTMPASAATEVWSENFNDWTVVTDYKTNGWVANNDDSAAQAELVTIDAEHGQSFKLAKNSVQIKYPVGLTSGQYKVDYSMYFQNDNDQGALVFMTGNINNPQYDAGEEALYNADKSSNSNALSMFWTGGNAYFGSGTNQNKKWATVYEKDTWYDISTIVDMDSRLYKTTVTAGGAKVYEITRIMDPNTNLSAIGFANWYATGTDAVIDNFKVTSTTEKLTKIVEDDFENYTRLYINPDEGETISPANSMTYAFNNGWWGLYAEHGGSYATPTLDSTTFPGNKVLGFFKAGTTMISHQFNNPIYEGKVKIKFSINQTEKGARPAIFFDDTFTTGEYDLTAGSNGERRNPQQYGGTWPATNDVYIGSAGNVNSGNDIILNTVPNEWYDWVYVIDLDTKKLSLTIEKDGKVITRKRGVDFGFDQICSFDIRAWDGAADGTKMFFLDDVVVEKLGDETPADYLMFENNFDTDTVDSMKKEGWVFSEAEGKTYAISDGVLNITGNGAGVSKRFANETADKIRISYNVKAGSGGLGVIDYVGSSTTVTGNNRVALLYLDAANSNAVYHTYFSTLEAYKIADYTANTWLTVENVIDTVNKTVTYKLTDQYGDLIGEPYTLENPAHIFPDADGNPNGYVTGIQSLFFRNWGFAGSNIAVDNVKVEYYYGIPKINEDQISMKYISGDDVDLTQAVVAPGIKSITLDFDAEVTQESTSGAITLKEKGGTAVESYTGTISGNTYVMTLDSILKPRTTYELTVAGDVGTSLGMTIGKDFTYEFTTGAAECITLMDGVYMSGQKIETLTGVTSGDIDVKMQVVNNMTNSADYTIIIGYYNSNNMMVYTDIAAGTVDGESSKDVSERFTLPDMTNVSYAKVFIWDSVRNAIPYCDEITL